MSCLQLSAVRPHINVGIVSRSHQVPFVSLSFTTQHPRISLRLSTDASTYQRRMPVCVYGSKGISENETSPWKSIEKTMGNFKEQSIEDILRQQIEKREYYKDGGNGKFPPRRGRGGGGGNSGGSADESFAGMFNEFIQVVLATTGFVFLYIFIVSGEELTRLGKDYIKYLCGANKSVRLRRAMCKWSFVYQWLTHKMGVQKNWLEREVP